MTENLPEECEVCDIIQDRYLKGKSFVCDDCIYKPNKTKLKEMTDGS